MEGVTDPKMLEGRAFYKLGEFTYDKRKEIIAVGLLFIIGLASLSLIGPDWANGWGEEDVESLNATRLLGEAFASEDDDDGQYRSFYILVNHPTYDDEDEEWQNAVLDATAKISERDDIVIEHSWDTGPKDRPSRVASDEEGNWALTVVKIEGDSKSAKETYGEIYEDIEIAGDFELWRTEGIAVEYTFDKRIQDDLIKAEIIAGPISLLILLVVFGTLVAAVLPIKIGVLTVAGAMGVTIWLSNVTDVTQYAINIISLIGIGVSIDYSLFLVNRYREELGRGHDVRTSVAMTVATSGKAVFYSGITVAIGLMGMLFFVNTSLPSLGIGGTLAVSIAMLYSVVFLPALLAVLGHKVNNGSLGSFGMKVEDGEDGIWGKIATSVMSHPWKVLVPTLIILLGAGLPFFSAELSISSTTALPPEDEGRIGVEKISDIWPDSSSNDALIVFDLDGGDPLSEENLRALHQWMSQQNSDDMIVASYGIAMPEPGMTIEEVLWFWHGEANNQTLQSREYLSERFVSGDVTFIVHAMEGSEVEAESRKHVEEMRENIHSVLEDMTGGENSQVLIGGFAAYSADNLQAISDALPYAIVFIFGATMILIFIQVRSVIIPVKAVVMNILSISASFGMMVVIFQWGYGADLLNFTPQPIDSGNPIILFCIVFGLSMDYEVLMLSRIHEEWERTGDNTLAVANGLQRTGRLITGAAAIMVVVFSAFGLSSVIILKQIGFGLALAILLDATVVRALVVPASMRLMGKWNWWTPDWLGGSKDTEKVKESEE